MIAGQKSMGQRSSIIVEGKEAESEIWMLKFVVQEVEKFRNMTKPGCDGGE